MLQLFLFRIMNDHLFVKGLFIRFIVRVLRWRFVKLLMCFFPYGSGGGTWDLIVLSIAFSIVHTSHIGGDNNCFKSVDIRNSILYNVI